MHTASGGKKADQPGDWVRMNSTKALMAEILIPGNPGFKSKAGRNGGTYVNEPLSYAYAAWISAEFHAAVIAAFTALAIINMKKAIEIVRSYAAYFCPCRK